MLTHGKSFWFEEFITTYPTIHLNSRLFGLIGFPLGHSFSQKYFSQKFEKEGIENVDYQLFPLELVDQFKELLLSHKNLNGLNVTIPYKQTIIPYLNALDPNAQRIGAVNVVKISKETGLLTGYNSDYFGFLHSLLLFQGLKQWRGSKALILGTGGSSKAVMAVLEDLEVSFSLVSREKKENCISYSELGNAGLKEIQLLVNCTPLGMFPNVETFPEIPLNQITSNNMVIDLVYNPEETKFLKFAKEKGAKIQNGLPMLIAQAEKSWEIWNR